MRCVGRVPKCRDEDHLGLMHTLHILQSLKSLYTVALVHLWGFFFFLAALEFEFRHVLHHLSHYPSPSL
jgi:hypothetical protein